jgi:hypothetical protein
MAHALTEPHRRALRTLLPLLNDLGIRYQITGGLAGNIYGSAWPLHDIDIDVARDDLPKLLARLDAAVVRPLSRLVDDEFDLELATVRLEGVEVDISQAEDAAVFQRGARVPLVVDLGRAEEHVLEGHRVRVVPLDDLIAYKELIGRTADLADLYRLRAERQRR